MPLTDTDRAALCHHLADRFPDYGDRARIAQDSGLADAQLTGGPLAVWTGLVAEAEAGDCVPRLLYVANQLRPDDGVLTQMATSAREGNLKVPPAEDPRVWLRNTAVAGVLVLLLGVGAIVGDQLFAVAEPSESDVVSTGLEGASIDQAAVEPSVPEPSTDSIAVEPSVPEPSTDSIAVEPSVPEPSTDSIAVVEVEEDPSTDLAVAIDPVDLPSTDVATSSPVSSTGRCAGPADTLIGYAYAGGVRPTGSSWRVPLGTNVRRDYPRKENGWSSKTTVVCILPKNTVLQLAVSPIPVGGGVWWIPVYGGGTGH
jgi:hypothetical protein